MVDLLVHKMYRAARHGFAGRESLFPRFQSRKFRQKRRMDVNDSPGKRLEHRRVQYPHKTGENHKINVGVAQYFHKLSFRFRL